MTAFDDLSEAGKRRRLHGLALAALAQYDLNAAQIAFHCDATNRFYRVTTAAGERFMLRLAAPGWRTAEDLRSEALWLEALARDTSIPVPRILPARSGEVVLPAIWPGIPHIYNVTLMSRVPGRLLGGYLSGHNLEQMGGLFAELHSQAAGWVPPAGFTTRRFEHWLSRGEKNVIVRDDVEEREAQLPAPARELLERMHQHVESSYAAVDRSDLRVIHCDLWHNNIKLYRGVLHPFDFEDTIWGFRAHDIAMAMLDLLEAAGEERYVRLMGAFRSGYEAYLAWPDDCIEPFQIGRLLWKINWVARNQPRRLASMVERYVPVFTYYEQTGRVRLPEA